MKGVDSVVTPGDRYGRWTVIKELVSKTKHRRVLCQCRCGTKRAVLLQNLTGGRTRSCGCTNKATLRASKARYRHLVRIPK